MLHHVELYVGDLDRSMAFWVPFMQRLGYETERWSGGVNFVRGARDPYLCFLPAPAEHLAAGYHRKRVGLNHLAFGVDSVADVDNAAEWLTERGIEHLFGTPRHRPEFSSDDKTTYYQVMFESPDKLLFEIVYTGPHQ